MQIASERVLWRHGLLTLPPTVPLCLGAVQVGSLLSTVKPAASCRCLRASHC